MPIEEIKELNVEWISGKDINMVLGCGYFQIVDNKNTTRTMFGIGRKYKDDKGNILNRGNRILSIPRNKEFLKRFADKLLSICDIEPVTKIDKNTKNAEELKKKLKDKDKLIENLQKQIGQLNKKKGEK